MNSGLLKVLLKPFIGDGSNSVSGGGSGGKITKSSQITSGNKINNIILFIILSLYSIRVVTRNQDWLFEMKIYESALNVCPLSVKANNNVGKW